MTQHYKFVVDTVDLYSIFLDPKFIVALSISWTPVTSCSSQLDNLLPIDPVNVAGPDVFQSIWHIRWRKGNSFACRRHTNQ